MDGWTDLDDGEASARCIRASKVEARLPVGDVEALDAALAGFLGGSRGQAQGCSEEGKARELHAFPVKVIGIILLCRRWIGLRESKQSGRGEIMPYLY